MYNKISIRSILAASWADFKREKKSFFMLIPLYLALIGIYHILIGISMEVKLGNISHGSEFAKNILLIMTPLATLLTDFITIFYTVCLIKISLDIVLSKQSLLVSSLSLIMKLTTILWIINFITKIFIGSYIMNNFASIYKPQYLVIHLVILLISCILSYIFIRYSFVDLLILEQGCTISQALSLSWDMTQGHFWLLLSFGFVILLLNLLGLAALFIGFVFITLPLTILMRAYLFKALLASKQV